MRPWDTDGLVQFLQASRAVDSSWLAVLVCSLLFLSSSLIHRSIFGLGIVVRDQISAHFLQGRPEYHLLPQCGDWETRPFVLGEWFIAAHDVHLKP